jgi:DNA-binding HxlR family transcriptional regulator
MPEIASHTVMNRDACPLFHTAIELLGCRWNGRILQVLIGGRRRFSELRNAIPDVTDAMLSRRLKDLESAGIVVRDVRAARPIEVHYELTDVGVHLLPVLDAIADWSNIWARARLDVTEQ